MNLEDDEIVKKYGTLKIKEEFFYYSNKLQKIEGWFGAISHGIFDCLLSFQNKSEIKGNLCEIGVYKGKSASVIFDYIKNNEKMMLIDPECDNSLVKKNINYMCGKRNNTIEFINKRSEFFDVSEKNYRTFRYIHIDGCHSGEAVYNDLCIADKMITNDGIVVVDDFFNYEYPQVTEAVYKFLLLNPYSFTLFLTGSIKAYLCRRNSYKRYYAFCTNELQKEMIARGIVINIIKTSGLADSESLGFSYRPDNTSVKDGYLGPDWARDEFEVISLRNVEKKMKRGQSNDLPTTV